MQALKISLITVVYNAGDTIGGCVESVIAQSYPDIEYIIIDGGSTDNTLAVIEKYKSQLSHFVSEPDKGIYDAMNKGIKRATGDIIGMLNADDFFADNNVLSNAADAFLQNNIDIVYGDLDYINKDGKVIRKWRSGQFTAASFNLGWMPPHPTFYCRRGLFEQYGFYSLDYGTAADYELMLRFLHVNKLRVFYLQHVIVKMKLGGKSNQTLNSRFKGLINDLKAMRASHIALPVLTLIAKPLRKITQYL